MIYNNKHVVFEQVGVDDNILWNLSTNKDNENCINNYEISLIRTNLNQYMIDNLSNELSSELTSTTIQTAKNGLSETSGTLISTNDKLFISAVKEIGYTSRSVSQENNALATWQYWTSHTTGTDHIKNANGTSTVKRYWLRSPNSNTTKNVVIITQTGNSFAESCDVSEGKFCCFAW